MANNLLCMITGASGGFGQALAATMATHICDQGELYSACTIIITGRNSEKLTQCKTSILELLPSCNVIKVTIDQNERSSCESGMRAVNDVVSDAGPFHTAYLFSNAGCLGDVSTAVHQFEDWEAIQKHFTANLISTFYIASKFIALALAQGCKTTLVNTSSLLAIKPASFTSLYCTGKAAADMLFAVIAEEHSPTSIKTISYGPGPMRTEMQTVLESTSKCESIVNYQRALREKGGLVEPMDSAAKLFRVLEKDKFTSGSHVDYYDEE